MLNISFDYNPHPKQKEVHTACEVDNGVHFVIVSSGRQSGKTQLAIMESIRFSLENPGSIVYWVSPTDSQSTKVQKEVVRKLRQSEILKSYKFQRGDAEIVFVNGSIIQYRSGASRDNLRGSTVDYLILDEAAFLPKETFEEILLPMVAVRGKKTLIISTPKGKNWFYEYWLKGQNENNTSFKSFKFTSQDNPMCDAGFIETMRSQMNSRIFAQEFLAEWIDSASVFENIPQAIQNTSREPQYNERYYMGIDIGMVNDYSAVVVFNSMGEMVFVDRFKNISNRDIKERIKKTYHQFKPTKAFIEVNNQGLPLWSDLRFEEGLHRLEAFQTTGKSKEKIINELIAAFNEKQIKILGEEWLVKEFESFIYKFNSKTRTLKFEAANGFHDDGVIATAIGWFAFSEHKHSGKYVVMTTTNRNYRSGFFGKN